MTSGGAGSGGVSAGTAPVAGASGSVAEQAGSAGASATAGGGGMGGTGGGGGGGSGVAEGGAAPAVASPGCGTAASQALASWVERPPLNVDGDNRQWWVWLPTGYEPTRPYPVVFTLHGCGGPNNFIPMQEETGADAIVVRGTGADNGCWTYGGEGDDVKFFDAMLAALEAQYCMDSSRVFAMGYSSGGWMTNTLECTRGDKLRATGTLSGGRAGNASNCKGKFARATVHDLDDPTNPFDGQGASQELDRVLAQNHCMTNVPPVMEAPAPCARYVGCDAGYPVIACRTEGQGHDRQDELAMDVFWRLFSSL
jgi:poly(3-hydroxybutyrate) depolymerase